MTAPGLRVWLEGLADAHATIPASEVLKRLPEGADGPDRSGGDMTLDDVAAEVGRAVSTIRTWCNGGRLQGAYRLNGRDWRVPRAALRAFLDGQGRGDHHESQHGDVDWGDWRTGDRP